MVNLNCLNAGLPEDILRLEAGGDFDNAKRLIDIRLGSNIPKILRERLEFEKIRVDRLVMEYTYTFEQALSIVQEEVNGFAAHELEKLKDEGYADWIFINGRVMFSSSFLRNIIKTCPEIACRLKNNGDDTEKKKEDMALDKTIDDIIGNGSKGYYIHIRAGVRLNKEYSKAGETARVHIPIPVKCQQVNNIKILDARPEAKFISPEDYPQRTVYFEKQVCGEDEFTVEYAYESSVQYKKLDYDKVCESQQGFDTEELYPHIVFTPYLKELAAEITGFDGNALKKARSIYDFITKNVRYSFVREYSTIENIPEYGALNLKGDCGIQALLFITLCRICGIPARWQSGIYVSPYFAGWHDWAQFYVEPYGWLFADTSFGGSAYRKGNTKRWNFYFGNIDPFRMPANSKFQYGFMPDKKFLRADPYDNQRGEVEYQDIGVYYNGFEPLLDIVEIHEI